MAKAKTNANSKESKVSSVKTPVSTTRAKAKPKAKKAVPAQATAKPEASAAPAKTTAKPKTTAPRKAKVTFSIQAPEAQSVFLTGTFNDWDQTSSPMKKGQDGSWTKTVNLVPGSYEYLFLVDGVWTFDPKAIDQIPNPFGTCNALLKVA